MKKLLKEVMFSQRFATGKDGNVYRQIRPTENKFFYFPERETLIFAVNENFELAAFSPEEEVFLIG